MQDKGDPSSSRRITHQLQQAPPLQEEEQNPSPSPAQAMQYNLSGIGSYFGGECEEFVFPTEPASSFLPWSGFQMLETPSWAPAGLQMSSDFHLRGSEGFMGPGLGAEFGRMNAQEIMDAKALAASKSHSEAERRRRERINTHLAKLRSLLPSTTKTDKASLLAEVIHHVKELKRQTTEIAEETPVPTETDELTVDSADDEGGNFVRVSLCCEDRPDLFSDIIRALKALRLRPVKAEIATLGGRVRNVIVVDSENNDNSDEQKSKSMIHEALRAVMERAPTAEEPSNVKRQRTSSLSI